MQRKSDLVWIEMWRPLVRLINDCPWSLGGTPNWWDHGYKFGEELEAAWFNDYVDRSIAVVFLIDLAEVQELAERGSLLPLRQAT